MSYDRLNAYHIMWLIIMFDLPVKLKKDGFPVVKKKSASAKDEGCCGSKEEGCDGKEGCKK